MRETQRLSGIVLALIMFTGVMQATTVEKGRQPEQDAAAQEQDETTRADLVSELADIESRLAATPDDPRLRLDRARQLLLLGEFRRAAEVIAPLAAEPDATPEVLAVAARLSYLLGRYPEAEQRYQRLIAALQDDEEGLAEAQEGLLRTYYQTNRFDLIRKKVSLPDNVVYRQADAFESDPYRQEWYDEGRVAIVPFIMTDPLPLLTIEVNRVPIVVFIDTGGDTLTIDPDIVEALGIEYLEARKGTFAGGQQAEVKLARVDRVELEAVTLHDVPINALPCKRFSGGFDGGKVLVGGVLGTAILRQFLSTIDYENGRLILRQRGSEEARTFLQELAEQRATAVPFALDRYHFMLAKGGLDAGQDLTFFVDSGLYSDACLVAPIQTLHDLGIPEPGLDRAGIGGGEGQVHSGTFPIERVGLGSLVRNDLTGLYGPLPPQMFLSFGFALDGVISHRYLRLFKTWTLDFDSMTFFFTE